MKKAYFLIGWFLVASLSLFAERVDPETAQKVATNFLGNNGAKASQLTDLSKSAGFPNLYIFNAEEGFVVMAADDCVKPILGYSLTGQFITEKMPENLVWWLQGYNDQIQDIRDKKLPVDTSAKTEWQKLQEEASTKETTEVVIRPLTNTLWDQNYPYNNLCPKASGGPGGHVYAGCVATAMAQVMKYWEYPVQGNGSHTYTHSTYGSQTANFGETTYDWENMPNSISSNSSPTSILAVTTLIYHCGVAVDMNYGTKSSGAYSDEVPNALINYFGYAPSTTYVSREGFEDTQWITFLQGELNEGRPLYYCGSHDTGGHAFVCDGYRSDNYFHFNWGWSGSDGNGNANGNNGYWAIGALNPGAGGSGSGTGTYNLNNAVLAWAEPLSSIAAPALSTSVSGTTVTLSWNAINGASSYDIYRDNAKIATVTGSTSYLDEEVVSGRYYQYYVRAVANETKSNPSNRISLHVFNQDYTPSLLTASVDDNDITLSWTPPQNSTDLHYGLGYSGLSYGWPGTNTITYWGQRYPASTLTKCQGMVINKVSVFLTVKKAYTGNYNYTLYIYQEDPETDKGLSTTPDFLYTYNFTQNYQGWKEIDIPTPVVLDCTKDLWIVFSLDGSEVSTTLFPAVYIEFDQDDYVDAAYISNSFDQWNLTGNRISWSMRTYLTDGAYTYNLYDGTTKVNGDVPISGTSYTIEDATPGTIHTYTVKTNYYDGESAASNEAGIALDSISLDSLSLDDDIVMTVAKGSTLTVGNLSNTNPANLIIEDGAQLIHPNNEVQATLNKTIQPYSAGISDGWYTIASPVDEYGIEHITHGDYDLYAYDEKYSYWRNQKNNANNITQFIEGKGFLYANAAEQPLHFAGNMKATDEQVAVPLSYQSSNENLKGFNLVGNPFTRNLNYGDIILGGEPLAIYYSVENGKELLAHNINTAPIKPGQGFLVQASAEGQDLVFNPSSKGQAETPPSFICIEVGDGTFTDRAFVQFDGGNILHKTSLSDHSAKLSVTQHHTDFAAVIADADENELTLSFKAVHSGLHTLNVSLANLDLDYLHLIDNLTGAHIDLLQTPSYSFEVRSDDYPARFRLLFHALDEEQDESNSSLEGDTQILDMTGRIVKTYHGHLQCTPSEGMAPGIYLLRTINGSNIKTEKIIIK